MSHKRPGRTAKKVRQTRAMWRLEKYAGSRNYWTDRDDREYKTLIERCAIKL